MTPGTAAVRTATRLAVAAVLGLVAALLLAAPGSAHAVLTGTDPADMATLTEVPERARLSFSDPLDPQFVQVRVVVPDGAQVAPEPVVAGKVVTVEVPDRGSGWYSVSYRVVSRDGHPVSGSISFAVGSSAPPTSPGAGRPTPAGSDRASTSPAASAGAPSPPVASPSAAAPPPAAPLNSTTGSGSGVGVLPVLVVGGAVVGVLVLVLLVVARRPGRPAARRP